MKYTIEVTQEDIDNGTPGHCIYCPIARAIERTLKTLVGVYGLRQEPSIEIWGETIPLSPQAAQAALEYDATGKMEPFSFEIELPETPCP